jgi:hypothetical protein
MYSSTAAAVITTEWVILTIGAVLILARLHLRLRINRQRLAISDIFLCLAWSSAAVCSSFDIVFMRMNLLRPDVDANLAGFHGDKQTLQRALVVSIDHQSCFICGPTRTCSTELIYIVVFLGPWLPLLRDLLPFQGRPFGVLRTDYP